MTLNTETAGRPAYVNGTKCEIIGTFGNYTRVRLLERDGCHLADDVVDYGSKWVLHRNQS